MIVLFDNIEFNEFENTQALFDEYCKQQTDFYYANGFEYIHQIHLNPKNQVLYLRYNGNLFMYLIEKKKDKETGKIKSEFYAYDLKAHLYFSYKYEKKLIIRFASKYRLDSMGLKYKAIESEKKVDAIHCPDFFNSIINLQGGKYTGIRQKKNKFEKSANDIVFRKYSDDDHDAVMELYSGWKNEYRRVHGEGFTGQIHGTQVFKKGFEEDYMRKYVLFANGVLMGFCSFYVSGVWAYNFTSKSRRDIKNASLYLYLKEYEEIHKLYPDVKYINTGHIKNPKDTSGFKYALKPDAYNVVLQRVTI